MLDKCIIYLNKLLFSIKFIFLKLRTLFKAKKYIVFIGFSGLLLIFFQNCGKFELNKIPRSMASYALGIAGLLESPTKVRAHTRLIFAIDQSQSMALLGCDEDLDGSNPKANPGACSPALGYDSVGKRFDTIKEWLEALKAKNEPDVQVMILPVSGGIVDANRKLTESNLLGFLSIDAAIQRLNNLKLEQQNEIQNPNSPAFNKKMGTSVPFGFLSYAQGKIEQEMHQLLSQRQLYTTLFEFYFISDGLYKPRINEVQKAMQLANCPMECVLDPDYVKCNTLISNEQVFDGNGGIISTKPPTQDMIAKAQMCSGQTGIQGLPQNFSGDACYCLTIGNALYKYLGRHEDNDPTKIITTLMATAGLSDYFMQGNISMNFVSVLDLNTPTPPGTINIFNEYKRMIPQARLVTLDEMAQAIPRSATPLQVLSYKIDKFYVVNLNAVQTETGAWVADSDADGLADYDEENIFGTDPLNERSNSNALYCLDGISAKFGCRMSGCNASLDVDGDNLNECEEKTLQTSSSQRDTSEDGIIDYIKVIKNINPLMDATTVDSNSDGFSDDQALSWGYNPLVNLNAIDTIKFKKMFTQVHFNDYVLTDKGNVPQYSIEVANIPLVATRAYAQHSQLTYDKFGLDPVSGGEYLGPVTRDAGQNDVIFLVKVRSNEVKEKTFWLAYRKLISQNSDGYIKLDLNQFTELRSTRWELW